MSLTDIGEEMAKLRASGAFDADWYASHYGDVPRGIDPLEHYIRIGRKLGRAGVGHTDHTRRVSARDPKSQRGNEDRKLPISALVISWDVGHNPVGRAYMVAEAVDRAVEHCSIAGFQFPRYGQTIWEPLLSSRLPILKCAGDSMPQFLERVEHIARASRPDIVIACKPRLPSLLAGLRVRDVAGCPLVVDIDDHELAFFQDQTPLSVTEIERLKSGSASGELEPYGERWTRMCETLVHEADIKLVSNTSLQKRFGGILVPHVRDERAFVPETAMSDRPRARDYLKLGSADKAVMFFGTPRIHKGLAELAAAVGAMADPSVKLVVVGTAPDRSVTAKLQSLAQGKLLMVPNQPFDQIPFIISAADIVALPQDPAHPVSQYQLPAKAIDAIAAGIPLLATATPPIGDLIRDGVATAFDPGELKTALEAALSAGQPPDRARHVRNVFLDKYSYASAARTLRKELAAVVRPDQQARGGQGARVAAAVANACGLDREAHPVSTTNARDVVVFWKQNDTTLYGRRHDMIAKYLARRADVRRVVVFDAPIGQFDLDRLRTGEPLTQSRLVYEVTQAKRHGLLDNGKIAYRSFVYPAGEYGRPGVADATRKPLGPCYAAWVKDQLATLGVEPAQATFLLYPKNFCLPDVLDLLKPARVIVDIVDDHRAWPNVTEAEKSRLTNHYRDILGRADFAMANCQPVVDAMRAFFPGIALVPNGCDTDPELEEPLHDPLYRKVCGHAGKVIGYVGNLEPKIDIDLLEQVSRAFPDALLVLVGSTHAYPEVRRLARLPNVVMPGVAPYKQANAWLKRFDVALIPHKRMDLTENMNPLKQYVYAAHGLPVVATNTPNLANDLVITAQNTADFVSKIADILQRKNSHGFTSKSVVENLSWSRRLAGLEV